MRRTSTPSPRAGFTLVELLVVITIIAILMSLTTAAVVKVIGKRDELNARNDISQLGVGIQAFKTEFGVSYIPSRLYLPPSADPTGESARYITSVWPRINTAFLSSGAYWGVPSS